MSKRVLIGASAGPGLAGLEAFVALRLGNCVLADLPLDMDEAAAMCRFCREHEITLFLSELVWRGSTDLWRPARARLPREECPSREQINAVLAEAGEYYGGRMTIGERVPGRYVFVDGRDTLPLACEVKAVIGGDGIVASIAAASIVAKVTRDRIMCEYDALYPEYGFARHKGYPTPEHMKSLSKYGACAIHRKSFAPVARRINPLWEPQGLLSDGMAKTELFDT